MRRDIVDTVSGGMVAEGTHFPVRSSTSACSSPPPQWWAAPGFLLAAEEVVWGSPSCAPFSTAACGPRDLSWAEKCKVG